MEKESVSIENEEERVNATEVYDVIINDRSTNDIKVNSKAEENDEHSDEEDREGNSEVDDLKESVDDVNKLLAAQAHAIEVFEMIKHLETEMEVIIVDGLDEDCFMFYLYCYLQEILQNKTESNNSEETTTTEPLDEIRMTTAKDNSPEIEEEGTEDDTDVDEEIEQLRSKVELLREKGNKIKDAIVEQTKLLLSEESLLSRLRTRILLSSLRKMRNKGNKKSVTLSKKQQQFLSSLNGLENLLEDLKDTDNFVRQELQQRRNVKKIKLILPRKKIRQGKDSILDHPTIIGVDSLTGELEDYEDLPTIIVEEEAGDTEPDTILVKDYEVDLDPNIEEVLVAVPAPVPRPVLAHRPSPHLHGHIIQHPRHHQYPVPRYPDPYHPHPHQEPYHHHQEPDHPPPHLAYHPPPQAPYHPRTYHAYHHPYPRYDLPQPLRHTPGQPPPPPPEPHITLTGELLAGFEHINGHFIHAK